MFLSTHCEGNPINYAQLRAVVAGSHSQIITECQLQFYFRPSRCPGRSSRSCRWVARISSYVNIVTAALCSGGEERVRHFHNGGGWVRRRVCERSGAVIVRATLPVIRARCPKMALVGKKDSDCTQMGHLHPDGAEPLKNSATTSATANQNGDQPGCGDSVMPEHEASERRRSVRADGRSFSGSPLPGQRPGEELPRKIFQIPRKTRERKGAAISVLF